MTRAPALKVILLGAVFALCFSSLAEPSLAANDECAGDSGIPSGVIAPVDVGHLRKSLADAGFTVGGFYLGETFGNAGGLHQGETYDGVLWAYLLGDLHKAGLWKGLCFYADSYQIHGRSITADNIGSLATVSDYEALPSTRLSEFWLEQHLFNDHVTVRVGQLRLIRNSCSVWGAAIYWIPPGLGPAFRPRIYQAAGRPTRWQHPACASRSSRTTNGI